jgi:hypothetical protein
VTTRRRHYPLLVKAGGGVRLTRRRLLRLAGLAAATVAAAGCASDARAPSEPAHPVTTAGKVSGPRWADAPEVDFSAQFSAFPVADEPNGDPARVVWPDWIERADGDVKRLYEFQLVNGELMKYMPCFCGCGREGHKNNRDCYVREVRPDGSVVFDDMAPT